MKLIDIIAGARPNFMKISPIIKALNKDKLINTLLTYRLIHTGQHFDANMSEKFFQQLGIPRPNINLKVNSGTQAVQTGLIMERYESVLLELPSDLCLVVGDVTSTMACAITAKKLNIPILHIEAGIRSGDWTMPEEINRVVTDSITDWFFTTSKNANKNLLNSGVEKKRIFFVGNTMIDTLLSNINKLKRPDFWDSKGLIAKEYFVLTLHRPSNVDNEETLKKLLDTIGENTRELPVIFPVHPRTKNVIKHLNKTPNRLFLVEPQAYLEFNYLVKYAKAVITDSGGITEETTVMGVPCITLRDNTERPETVTNGTNVLAGTDPKKLKSILDILFDNEWKNSSIPEKWDGHAGQRIVNILKKINKFDTSRNPIK